MAEIEALQLEQIPARFRPAVRRIQQLRPVERYQAAYVFGSVARGDATAASDLDVHVLVTQQTACANLNHPIIDGVKLDLTFLSFDQLATRTAREIETGARVPMVAESAIVFDKTGELTRLRATARHVRPKPSTAAERQAIQFTVFHAHNKAERMLTTDPPGALLVMHTSLSDLVNTHYRIHSRWRISDKRLLADLRGWDPTLAALIERLVCATPAQVKFAIWTGIVDYVMAPLGGRQPIEDMSCACAECHHDRAALRNGSLLTPPW